MNQQHFRGLAGVNLVPQGSERSQASRPATQAQRPKSPQVSQAPQGSQAPRTLTPQQARSMSMTKTSGSPKAPPGISVTPQRPPNGPQKTPSQVRQAPRPPPSQGPPSKLARMGGISLTPSGSPGGQGLPVESFKEKEKKEYDEESREKSIRKEVEGLETLELLDNLVNFLNE